jgi:hypothetical protein
MNQFNRCLALLKENGGQVTCGQLASRGLFHKAASRLGVEARRKGYQIAFIKGVTWDTCIYKLVSEPSRDGPGTVRNCVSNHFEGLSEMELPLDDKNEDLTTLVGGW